MFDAEASAAVWPIRRYWLATTEGPGFSGGIGVYTHQTARMFSKAGVAVTVLHHDPTVGDPIVGFRDGYRLIRFASRDLARRPIPHANLHGPLRAAMETSALLRDLIAAEGAPDVVEVQDYGALAHAFLKHRLIHADQAWPRVVLTAHRPNAHCAIVDGEGVDEHRAAFLADAERWCYAAADAVLAPCAFIGPALAKIGFPTAGAKVVFNPYDASDVEQMQPAAALGPERTALEAMLHTPAEPVLYFGKLQAQKGAPDLLAALDALHTEGEGPPVWLFGRDAFLAGTPTTAFDALERRHGRLFESGRARYFGGYGLADLKALCGEHPIVALPYREDCLPYAFIEAVLCGAIPLTRANGGQAELIPAELHALLLTDFDRPDVLGERLAAVRSLGPLARRALSRRLQAAVRAATDPAAVLRRKLAALAEVSPTYAAARYPFVYGPSQVFGAVDPGARRRLADAVPQRGAIRSVRHAGPAATSHPDLVSVVIPYFDMDAFVDETLAAVEAQDHAAVEVLIVDDGSRTTQGRDRLDALLAAPRRYPTTVLRKTNGGLADARNAGARLARGDYLYFLDADDVIHPSTLSRSLRLLKRFDNVGYVGAGLKEFGDSENEWAVFDVDGPYVAFHNVQICAFLARTQAWLAHGRNDPAMSFGMEDLESHVRMSAAGVRGIAIPEPLFGYRKRAGSMSRAFEPHAVAYLYRCIRQANPGLFRRFGPELVGLYAENGHGALAPSACEPSQAHTALFGRDVPGLDEVAGDLERHASRHQLSRALRARCATGGTEWDYTTARLLLALDRAPGFTRQLLRTAVAAAPDNGWFRLYALIAELRDGRLRAAQTLCVERFAGFCRAEAGAILWVAALEAARGFPHVTLALRVLLGDAYGLEIAATRSLVAAGEATAPDRGEFADLHHRLSAWRKMAVPDARGYAQAEAAVLESATRHVSTEAASVLAHRWRMNWRDIDITPAGVWGQSAPAYLVPSRLPAGSALEADDRSCWVALVAGQRLPAPERLVIGVRRAVRSVVPIVSDRWHGHFGRTIDAAG